MKNIVFLLALLWLCNAQAQNFPLEPSLPEKLAHLCAPLDKAQVPTGYLYNLAVPLVEPLAYRGSIGDSNSVDINTFGMLYGEMLGIRPKNLFFTFTPYLRRQLP